MTPSEQEYTNEQNAVTMALLLSTLSDMKPDDMIRAARTIAYLGRVMRGDKAIW